jgi:hypothetical protein
MALIKAVGLESGDRNEFNITQNWCEPTLDYARSGNYSYYVSTNQGVQQVMFTPQSEAYIQFAIRSTINQGYDFFSINSGVYDELYALRLGSDVLQLLQGWNNYEPNGTVLLSGITPVPHEEWFVIEIHYKLHASDGIFNVRFNGLDQFSLEGNTKPGTATTFNTLSFNLIGGGAGEFYVDDIIVHDITGDKCNSWPNGVKIARIVPDISTGVNQWTPSVSGVDHEDLINDLDDDTFLSTEVTGAMENFSLTNLPADCNEIIAVTLNMRSKKTRSGIPPETIIPILNIEGTDYELEAVEQPYEILNLQEIYEDCPDGGNWTDIKIDTMQLGLKSN